MLEHCKHEPFIVNRTGGPPASLYNYCVKCEIEIYRNKGKWIKDTGQKALWYKQYATNEALIGIRRSNS